MLIGALVLDLLAIHPVADGRLARLITTYELLSQGYGVARYVSLEQRIFESKHSYYASLDESQREWHDGNHSIWPWTSYFAQVLADAYDTFERRVAAAGEITGSKQDRVREYVLHHAPEAFRRRDVERVARREHSHHQARAQRPTWHGARPSRRIRARGQVHPPAGAS